jgi:acetolactate synthase-1/2/3 large subunit
MTTTRIGGHLLVECLVAQGVTHAFGVPGESYLAVLDGFHAHADRIRFVINRQEGGAAFMADAHARLTGRPGVCFVTRGPGATNASIGVHTAFQDSTPMVLFVGDVASDTRDREAFQEVDYGSFFGPSTKGMAKRVERIDDVARIPEYVARAFATAMNGRPGPVVLVLPEDMLAAPVAAGPGQTRGARRRWRVSRPVQAWSDPGALRTLRTLLLAPERPIGDRRWRRLDRAGGPGAAAVCRELEVAGGQCVPLPGHLRQPPSAVCRRRGHRHQPARWRGASRTAI